MSLCHAEYQVGASGRYSLISPIGISVLQSFGLIVLRLCAQAFHLRTCRTIVVSVALQEVDNTPNAKSGSESDNECLQYVYCAVEKCHIKLLSAALRLPEKGHKKRRSVFDNCRGHKSPRCVISAARRYSVVRVRLPAAIRARSRGAYHVARVYCFYFKLPPFQKVVCRQA